MQYIGRDCFMKQEWQIWKQKAITTAVLPYMSGKGEIHQRTYPDR